MYRILSFCVLFSLLSSCGVSRNASSNPDGRADQILKRLDRDGDQRVSTDEVKFPMTESIFQAHDTNNDNYLDRAEIIAYLQNKDN
ncbi:MAG: hypothetical protein AAGJ93_01105 [Bacteroidota bacterium]